MSIIKDKLSILIAEKTQSLIKSIVPQVIDIAKKTGIQNIGTPSEMMPDYCLTNPELQKILIIRDKLVEKLNITYSIINSLSKPLNILNTTVNASSKALDTVSTARKVANVAITFIPSPPGAAISTINNLKDLEEFLNPQIVTAKNSINSITQALDLANRTLKNLMNLLKSIDKYLTGCGISNLAPLSKELQALDNTELVEETPTNEIYLGFILEIVKEPFSPTVTRRKAVAKNKDGIILLQTPLSFTTEDNILIEELKLIIDSNNLKAD